MRIVVLIPKLSAAAEFALKTLLEQKDLKVVGILRSDLSPLTKGYWKYLVYGVKRSGLFYGFLIGLSVYLNTLGLIVSCFLWWRRQRVWKTANQLAKKNEIPLHDIENINNSNSIQLLKNLNPDIILSLYFNQILKKEVLCIAKKANLNMHPGLLPKYKGLWPNFWKLLNKEKYAGVSIHHITRKIDDGDVIAQKKYPIKKTDTNFGLIMKSAIVGSQLLVATLKKLKTGIHIPKLKLKGKPVYYSLPQKHNFKTFYARGKRLFSLGELAR